MAEDEVPSRLSSQLRNMVANPKYSDLTFQCDGEDIPAHRAIVCAGSPVLDAACGGSFQEAQTRTIEVTVANAAALKRMLTYLYTEDYDDGYDSDFQEDHSSQCSSPAVTESSFATHVSRREVREIGQEFDEFGVITDREWYPPNRGPPAAATTNNSHPAQVDFTAENHSIEEHAAAGAVDASPSAEEYAAAGAADTSTSQSDGTPTDTSNNNNNNNSNEDLMDTDDPSNILTICSRDPSTNDFLQHNLAVYIIADYYHIPSLCELAIQKFNRVAREFEHDGFADVIVTVYNDTPAHAVAFRRAVKEMALDKGAELFGDKEFMKKVTVLPEFMQELLTEYARS
ncbi:MAG: hypothetical protein M1831_003754 [Alyxoria varia]|nr:MAG: hypothetical protein M1831_003754 [Alyxoria varia]